ncbi:glycosyltransferase [Rufibacter sediminis]|uniref:Glycosyltransferase n=1 Tax=Rufibacter sediminis TaxID=2762756 RepID=A0ABR6VPQ6_9BACT|nr:glycosyltransferase [Rufibacter sediminis]MBC3539174.1 glycosyltransferase [Rufibacter sediminis]
MEGFGILACPAYSTREGNPYNYILYSNMEKQGYPIYEFDYAIKNSIKFAFSSKYRIFHIHWPSNVIFGNSFFKANLKLNLFFAFIRLIRRFNKKVVWTVHNLEDHEGKFPALQKKLNDFLYSQVDGFISLNGSGLELISKKTGSNGHKKLAHIFHPHYKNYYQNTISRAQAREKLGISPEKFVFLFLGQIRAYKNVTGLIKAFNDLKNSNSLLLVAGNVHEDIKTELEEQLSNSENVLFVNSFVRDEDLQLYFNGADVVVTPYNKIFNSGSALLNLSFNKPTLAPDLWALTELKQLVGSRWIKTYQGQISAEVLEKGMAEILNESDDSTASQPNITRLDPEAISSETIAFYRSLLT